MIAQMFKYYCKTRCTMLEVPVTKLNYHYLPQIIEELIADGDSAVVLNIVDNPEFSVPYKKLRPYVYEVLEYEDKIDIFIQNIPLCYLENAEDHAFSSKQQQFAAACSNCSKRAVCSGVSQQYLDTYGDKELQTIRDKPREIIIEVTSKCNFDCHFCFNKNSHAPDGVRTLDGLPTADIKNIIDQAVAYDIMIVRFSGGEPLLRPDIVALCKYAKEQGREVRINTNGTLLTQKFLDSAEHYIDNMLIALNTADAVSHTELSKQQHSFNRIIEGIKRAKASAIPIVRSGTCMNTDNINHFYELYDLLINQLGLDDWEFYRPVAHPGDLRPTTSEDMKKLIEKATHLKDTDRPYFIVNSFPYCVLGKDKKTMKKVRSISVGARYDDGHTRFVIDPQGNVFPSYYLTKNIGNHTDIMAAWNHPFMKQLRNNEHVPQECKTCSMLYNCKGGSRFHAQLLYGSYDAQDPLMYNAPSIPNINKFNIIQQ